MLLPPRCALRTAPRPIAGTLRRDPNACLLVLPRRARRPNLGPRLERDPFSELLDSTGEFVDTPWTVGTTDPTSLLSPPNNVVLVSHESGVPRLNWALGSSRIARPAYLKGPTCGAGFARGRSAEQQPRVRIQSLRVGRGTHPPLPPVIVFTAHNSARRATAILRDISTGTS